MTGCLPIFLQMKRGGGGGGGHPTASDIRVSLQPGSCRPADSESGPQGVARRLDSAAEVAWTSLSFGRSSSGRSRANLIESSRRS